MNWREEEAADFNSQERSNLRSWGYDMPDPPPGTERAAPTPPTWQEVEWASFTPEERNNLRDCLPYKLPDPPDPPDETCITAAARRGPVKFEDLYGVQVIHPGEVLETIGSDMIKVMREPPRALCQGSCHCRQCTESSEPGGLCGSRAHKVIDPHPTPTPLRARVVG